MAVSGDADGDREQAIGRQPRESRECIGIALLGRGDGSVHQAVSLADAGRVPALMPS